MICNISCPQAALKMQIYWSRRPLQTAFGAKEVLGELTKCTYTDKKALHPCPVIYKQKLGFDKSHFALFPPGNCWKGCLFVCFTAPTWSDLCRQPEIARCRRFTYITTTAIHPSFPYLSLLAPITIQTRHLLSKTFRIKNIS